MYIKKENDILMASYKKMVIFMYQNSFSAAAATLGIIGMFCAFLSLFWFTFLFGALAIILAVLSMGRERRMCRSAKIGFITGTSAIVLQTCMIAFTVYSIIYVPEFRQEFITTFYKIYEQMYGVPFDESYPDFLNQMGISL